MYKVTKMVFNTLFTFINENWSTSNKWGHKTTLFRGENEFEIGSNKIRYYNRTWESYEFQSCMQGCVSQLIDERIKLFINRYKDINNITRFKKGEKEKVILEAKKQGDIVELEKLYIQL